MKDRWRELKETKSEWLHRIRWNWNIIIENRKYGLVLRTATLLLMVLVFALMGIKESCNAQNHLQEDIASEIIRFHVIANSDLDVDQEVKMKVKDAVITALHSKMADTNGIEEARAQILANEDMIREVAVNTLLENGFRYDVQVSLAQEQFPIKVYGDITLPAGEYEALCIRLGKAEGHNWWCIVFPTLCYVDETYSYVPDESKNQLKNVLTEEEFEEISKDNTIQIKVKSRLWDLIKKYF